MGLFDFLKKMGKVFLALGVFILSFFVFLIVLNLLPGTMDADPNTGKQTMKTIPTLICIIGPFISTYAFIKRHNSPKLFNLKFKRKAPPTSEGDWTAGGSTSGVDMRTEEELIESAKKVILTTGWVGVSVLQRELNLGYARAARIIDTLEARGFVGPFEGNRPREILFSWDHFQEPLAAVEKGINLIDEMDGHDFEYWCADLLKKDGFEKVEVTPGSGDQGVDVLAEKGGVKYAIQCKCYSKDLGNTPIQEVESGRIYYGCHVGVVMTNRYFTSGAKDLAQKTGTLLWDRDFIEKVLQK